MNALTKDLTILTGALLFIALILFVAVSTQKSSVSQTHVPAHKAVMNVMSTFN